MWDFVFYQQAPVSKPEGRTTCTLIPGDGVGPEMMQSMQEVLEVLKQIYILCDELFVIRYGVWK
jgi:isocitrate dehydrogenase